MPEAALQCPLCCRQDLVSVEALREHLLYIAYRPVSCPVCRSPMADLQQLVHHLDIHIDPLQDDEMFSSEVKSSTASKVNDVALVVPDAEMSSVQDILLPMNDARAELLKKSAPFVDAIMSSEKNTLEQLDLSTVQKELSVSDEIVSKLPASNICSENNVRLMCIPAQKKLWNSSHSSSLASLCIPEQQEAGTSKLDASIDKFKQKLQQSSFQNEMNSTNIEDISYTNTSNDDFNGSQSSQPSSSVADLNLSPASRYSIQTYICSICGAKFFGQDSYFTHLQQCKNVNTKNINSQGPLSSCNLATKQCDQPNVPVSISDDYRIYSLNSGTKTSKEFPMDSKNRCLSRIPELSSVFGTVAPGSKNIALLISEPTLNNKSDSDTSNSLDYNNFSNRIEKFNNMDQVAHINSKDFISKSIDETITSNSVDHTEPSVFLIPCSVKESFVRTASSLLESPCQYDSPPSVVNNLPPPKSPRAVLDNSSAQCSASTSSPEKASNRNGVQQHCGRPPNNLSQKFAAYVNSNPSQNVNPTQDYPVTVDNLSDSSLVADAVRESPSSSITVKVADTLRLSMQNMLHSQSKNIERNMSCFTESKNTLMQEELDMRLHSKGTYLHKKFHREQKGTGSGVNQDYHCAFPENRYIHDLQSVWVNRLNASLNRTNLEPSVADSFENLDSFSQFSKNNTSNEHQNNIPCAAEHRFDDLMLDYDSLNPSTAFRQRLSPARGDNADRSAHGQSCDFSDISSTPDTCTSDQLLEIGSSLSDHMDDCDEQDLMFTDISDNICRNRDSLQDRSSTEVGSSYLSNDITVENTFEVTCSSQHLGESGNTMESARSSFNGPVDMSLVTNISSISEAINGRNSLFNIHDEGDCVENSTAQSNRLPEGHNASTLMPVSETNIPSSPLKASSERTAFPAVTVNSTSHSCKECQKTFLNVSNYRRHIREVHNSERSFSCSVCSKNFRSERQLTNHKFLHETHKKFQCNICQHQCYTAAGIRSHKFQEHRTAKQRKPPNRPYNCAQCNETFAKKFGLKRHIQRKHEGKQHFCSECNKVYTSLESLQRHVLSHNDGGGSFICSTCGAHYKSNFALKRHKSIHHRCNNKSGESSAFISSSSSTKPPQKQNAQLYVKSGTSSENFSRVNANLVNNRNSQVQTISSIGGQAKDCINSRSKSNILGDNFVASDQFQDNPLFSSQATSNSSSRSLVTSTSLASTSDSSPLLAQNNTCDIPSPMSSSSVTSSNSELMAPHCEEGSVSTSRGLPAKLFSCSVCCRDFTRNDSLRVHMRAHTKERPYHCNQCEMAFSRKSLLTIHQDKHKDVPGYHCHICNKRFQYRVSLRHHSCQA